MSRARRIWPVGAALLIVALELQSAYEVRFLRSLSRVGADFLNQIYVAGGEAAHGRATWLSGDVHVVGTTAPYLPPVVFAFAPFSRFPEGLAIALWLAVLAAAAVAVLPVLGVGDWRLYVLWLLSPPVVIGLYYGNITLLLVLALALMWRFRDRAGLCSAAAVFMTVVKLWPFVFVLWMWMTGRRRAAVYTAVATPLLVLATWGALSFAGLRDYPSTLNRFSERFARNGYSIVSILANAGTSVGLATVVASLVALALLVAATRADEGRSLLLIVCAGLASSTIVWLHYYGFLVVAFAILAPELGALWVYPLALWLAADLFARYGQPSGAVAAVVVSALFVAAAMKRPALEGAREARSLPPGLDGGYLQ